MELFLVVALLVLALVCFVVAAFRADTAKVNFAALGLAFFTLAEVIRVWP